MGVRGGADQADTTKPLIATDVIAGGAFDGEEMGVTKLATGAAGAAVLVSAANGMPVTPAIAGAVTDGSGTITTGGTAQTPLAANTARRWLFIQNLDPAEDLWFNIGVTAVTTGNPSIRLGPYQTYENPSHFCPSALISVKAATTGHKFTAKEG